MSYSPNLGRWLQEDPIGFDAGDPNLYRYVGNEPTGNVDPSGLDALGAPVSDGAVRGRMAPPQPSSPRPRIPLNPISDEAVRAAMGIPPPPKPPKVRGPGVVETYQRPAYSDMLGPDLPGVLPHRVIVIRYGDDTFKTYSFGPSGWVEDDTKDRNWCPPSSWCPTVKDKDGNPITGDVIEEIIRIRRPKDSYDFFGRSGHNCQTATQAALEDAGAPKPTRFSLFDYYTPILPFELLPLRPF